ncbi:MAG: hypothetical protein ABIW31_08810 [Novosphingobium sp.]
MSGLRRRDVIKGAAGLGALALPLRLQAMARSADLIVYDRRIAESRAFARTAGPVSRLEVTEAHRARWAQLRAPLGRGRRIEGLTVWSDWSGLRGELERQGLRLVHEALVSAPASGHASLVRWTMAGREMLSARGFRRYS